MRSIEGTVTEHPAFAAAREAGVTTEEHPAQRRIERANELAEQRQREVAEQGVRLNTVTGLHGRLIAWADEAPERTSGPVGGWAIVQRESAPFEERPYSVHFLYRYVVGDVCAESGIYDLTLAEARTRWARLAGFTGAEVAA